MPTKCRLEIAGAAYQVTARGVAKSELFRDELDRGKYFGNDRARAAERLAAFVEDVSR